MYELGRLHTLASPRVLIKQEILIAFHEVLGIPKARPPFTQIFGVGTGFAFGEPPYRYRVPEPLRSVLLQQEPGRVADYETWGTEQIERGLLFGPRTDVAAESHMFVAEQRFGERYALGERELAGRLKQEQVSPKFFADVMSASEMVDILKPLNEVAADLGIDLGQLLSHKDFDGRSFLEHIPSRVVVRCLRTARHRNRQIKWKANDLHDVGGLAFAIPYCDVVCTEKSWVHHTAAARLDRRFSTRLISDVSELTSVIASAS